MQPTNDFIYQRAIANFLENGALTLIVKVNITWKAD